MKIAFFLCLLSLNGFAQTYVNYQMTTFTHVGNSYVVTTNIVIPTNTLGTVMNLQGNSTVTGVGISIQYGANPVITLGNPSDFLNIPALGPAKVSMTFTSSVASGNYCGFLAKFETVNTTPNLQGYAIQPNGHTATVALQRSADMINWTTVTNGNYSMTNKAEFFRMNFVVQ